MIPNRHDVAISDDAERSYVEQVLTQLQAHEAGEREVLEEYRGAASSSADPGVRFLMGLILEDEERHQRLLSAITGDLADSVQWVHAEPALPSIAFMSEKRHQLTRQNQRFLAIEEQNLRDLKLVRVMVRELRSELLNLLLDSMEADTQKHIGILNYIRKQLEH